MEELEGLKELLAQSPWFDTVEADRDGASLLVTLQDAARTPHHHLPGHGPGMLLVALVIPVGWEHWSGHRLTVARPGSEESVDVDTRRASSALVGTLAPLFNFHPDLSFWPSEKRELDQIHAQLLPLVEGSAIDPGDPDRLENSARRVGFIAP